MKRRAVMTPASEQTMKRVSIPVVLCLIVGAQGAWAQTEAGPEPASVPASVPASTPASVPASTPAEGASAAIQPAAPAAVVPAAHRPSEVAGMAATEGAAADDDPNTMRVKKYPFRGSTFLFGQNLGTMGMVQSSELTWNPVYYWQFRLAPRYYFELAWELTDSDETTKYHQVMWQDVWLDTVYANAYTDRYSGISVTPSLRLILPASKNSQARSLYLGMAPGFSLKRTFKLPRGMELTASYAFRYTKALNKYTTVQYEAPTIASCGVNDECGELIHTGVRNPSHSFANTFAVDLDITPKLHVSTFFAFLNSLLYPVTTGEVDLMGGESLTVGEDPVNNVNHRAALWYVLEASYDLSSIVNLSLGLSTYHPQLADDSHYRMPFVNRFTEVSLTATVNLDYVVAGLERRFAAPRRLARAAVTTPTTREEN
jgi:hypothetical protein